MPRTITFALVDKAAVERVTLDPQSGGEWVSSITYVMRATNGSPVTRQVHTKTLSPAAAAQIDVWLTNQLNGVNADEGLI